MLKAIVLAAGFASLLTSCGGTRYHLHPGVPAPAGTTLAPVALTVGESRRAVQHSQGIAIVGGYVEGLVIENPTIAVVRYGKDGTGDKFDPVVCIVGLRPGTTRAAYGNRLGEPPNFVDPDTGKLLPHSFLIHVTDPGASFARPAGNLLTSDPAPDSPSS